MVVIVGLARDENDFRLDHPRIANHAAARLDDGLRDLVAEVLAQRRVDCLAVFFSGGNVAKILGRETAAHIDHLQVDALLGKRGENALGIANGCIPCVEVHHLRTDMEGHAVGFETQLVCIDQNVDSHLRHAAELARQRPFGTFAIGQNAAEYAGTWGCAGNLLDFLMAVHGEEIDAERVSACNIAFLLDGVAEGNTVGGRTRIERHLDFSHGGAIEVGAHGSEQLQDFRSRVCLDGVIDRAVRQGVTERVEIIAHDVEIDHKAGTFGTAGIDEVEDASSRHRYVP